VPLLDDCFQERYPDELKQAVDLCADLPKDMLDIVKTLCQLPNRATALELVDHTFPQLHDPVRLGYAEGQATRLDELCKRAMALIKDGDKFTVASNVYKYAFKIAMNVT
jgi:hypothetical protein